MATTIGRKHYWAVRPVSMPDHIRIEHAHSARSAVGLAFGRTYPVGSPMYQFNIGKWQVKDLGTRVSVIQSDSKRIALLRDAADWFDPFVYIGG